MEAIKHGLDTAGPPGAAPLTTTGVDMVSGVELAAAAPGFPSNTGEPERRSDRA